MAHAEFLELVLADEVTRREASSAMARARARARAAGLETTMCLENWDDSAAVTYVRGTWAELCSLRFIEGGHNVVIMGPVRRGRIWPRRTTKPGVGSSGPAGRVMAARGG